MAETVEGLTVTRRPAQADAHGLCSVCGTFCHLEGPDDLCSWCGYQRLQFRRWLVSFIADVLTETP